MGIAFQILYEENPYGMYFTGQEVRGRAIVSLNKSVCVKGVTLRVRGFAKVKWEETHGNSVDTYSDQIDYFDSLTDCIDTKGLEHTLEPGVHTFTFACLLPENCPSSFKGTYGWIHYETKITLVRPLKMNKSYSRVFNVVKIVDLNPFYQLRIPTKLETFKTFCCGPCKSKPLVLIMDIPQTGYVPGEVIHINAALVNQSSTKVEKIKVSLNLKAFYKTRRSVSKKWEKIKVVEITVRELQQDHHRIKETIRVPPTPPTCGDLCEILKISYELELTAKVSQAHISPTISIPIVIGNIPLISSSACFAADTLIANLQGSVSCDQQNKDDDALSPPSYEEVVYMEPFNENVSEKIYDDTQFERYMPRYPYYSERFPYLAKQDK